MPGGFGDLAHEPASTDRVDRLVAGDGFELPILILLEGAHELVGDPDRVVGVLILDGRAVLAVEVHVEARVTQCSGLLLLVGLAPDEVLNVGVIDVEDDHLRRAPGLAAGLDRARTRIGATHEADGTTRRAAAGQGLLRRADLARLMPEPDPPLKIVPSSTYQLRIELMWSSTARMKQAEHCCGVSGTPTLNQTGELKAAFWVTMRCVSSSAKTCASSGLAK